MGGSHINTQILRARRRVWIAAVAIPLMLLAPALDPAADKTHLVVQALEAAECVEHALAPQELIGGGRELIAVGAELQFLLRTMIPQIAREVVLIAAVKHFTGEDDRSLAS